MSDIQQYASGDGDNGEPTRAQCRWITLHDHESALRQRDERIEELVAENAELERKGKDLCQAYGTSLMTIAELKKQLARLSAPVTDAEWIEHRQIPTRANPAGTMYRSEINELIAARKEKP